MKNVTLIVEFSAPVSRKVARDLVLLSTNQYPDSPNMEETFELLSELEDTSDESTAGTMFP